MSKFIALIFGKGVGCDYSIGCNQHIQELRAENWNEITKEIKEIKEYFGKERIDRIEVVEVGQAQEY